MDWTIPGTFYPSALPAILSWTLFMLVILGTTILTKVIANRKGLQFGLLASIPIGFGLLILSVIIGIIITFFIHDV